MFSKACEYAVLATIYIASETRQENRVGIEEICNHIRAPRHFTAKILQALTRRGLVGSQKGAGGGFFMNFEQRQKSLRDIVEAIDGNGLFIGCGLGLKQCSETRPCPIHHQFRDIRTRLTQMMEGTTVDDMAEKLKRGESVLIQ